MLEICHHAIPMINMVGAIILTGMAMLLVLAFVALVRP